MNNKLTLALALLLLQAGLSGAAAYSTGIITLSPGDIYTLQDMYANVSNDSVFFYNDTARTGILSASIDIPSEGKLYLSNETLFVNSSYDGQYFIAVNGGALHMNESSNLTALNASLRYYVVVNMGGSLKMSDSHMSYAGYEYGDNGNHSGLWIGTTNESIIRGNTFSNNYIGVFMLSAANVVFSNNTVLASNSTGAHIEAYTGFQIGNYISGNNISGSPTGIYLKSVQNTQILSNRISSSAYGIRLNFSNSSTISGSNISAPVGIYLDNSHSNSVSSANISATGYGVYLNFSNSNTISGSNISAPIGMYLDNSHLNSISSANIFASEHGVYLNFSNSTTISSSTVSAPSSLYLGFSDSGTFSFNKFSSTQHGAYSHFSSSNFFLSSNLSSPTYGLFMNASSARFEGSNVTQNASLFNSSATFLGSYFDFLNLDALSNITRMWHPPIYIWNATAPLSGANFSASDPFGTILSVLSDSNGRVFLNLTQYFQNSTDRLNYTPHNLTIFRGALRFLSPYSFENESQVTFSLIPPDIYWTNISLAITGGNVSISANVSDSLNLSSVLVGIRNSSGVERNFSMNFSGGSASNGSYEYNFSANGSLGTHSVWIYANNSQNSRSSFFAGSFDVHSLSFSLFNISDSFGQQDGIMNPNESFRTLVKIQEYNGSSYFPVSEGAFNITINGMQYELQFFNDSFWISVSNLTASGAANYSSFSANVSGVSSNNISGFSSANYSYSVRTSSVSANISSLVANQNSSVTVSGIVSYFNGSHSFNSSSANVSFWVGGSFAGSALADENGSYSYSLTIPSSAGTHQILINATDSFGIVASNSTFVQARLLVGNITLLGIPSGSSFVTRGTLVNISAFVRKSPLGNITSVVAAVSGSVNHTLLLSNATRTNESGWWVGLLNLSSVSHSLGNSTVTIYANESTNLTQQVPAPSSSFRVQNISLSLSLSSSTSSPNSLIRFYGRAILNPDNSNVSNRLLYLYSTDQYSNTTPIIINESFLLPWDRNTSWLSGSFGNSTVSNGTVVINNTQAFFRDNLSLLSSSTNITIQAGARLSRAGDAVFSFSLSNRTGPLSWGNSSLWYAQNATKTIFRFHPNGTAISNFSFNPSITPTGIAYVDGFLFVSDAFSLQLYNFSSNGSLNSNASLQDGSGVSLAFDGNNFWTSAYGNWLFKLNLNGSYDSNLSTNASNITGIAWDGTYLFYVDSNSSMIHGIFPNGTEASNFSTPNGNKSSYGLAWDGSNLWTANNFTGRAYQVRTESSLFGNLTSSPIEPQYPVVWNSFSAGHDAPNGTNISYLLLDSSTGAVLCDLSNNTNVTDCANSTSVRLFANLTTNDSTYFPVIYNWSLSWTANYSTASYLSNTTSTEYPIIFVSSAVNKTNFPDSNVSIEFSIDNGTTWLAANRSYTWAANFSNRNFRYRALFNTSNQSVSASLDKVFFEYRTAPHTDINGSFNYTFTSPQSYGEYLITANLTDLNGIFGENSASLSVPAPPQVFVVGSSAPVIAETEETLSALRLYPGTATPIAVTIPGVAVTEFLVSVKKIAINVLISVKRLKELPEHVPSPGGSVYRFLEFSKANLEDDNIQGVVVRFKVEKQWLSGNDLNRSSVALLRYSGGNWAALKTSLYKIDDNYTYYESELPGFSFFAIKAEKNVPPLPPSPPPPPPPPEQPPPPPLLRQRDIDIALERFYSLNDTAVSEEARNILYQALDKLQLSQKAFSSGNLTLAKDLLSQASLLMDASSRIKVAKVETPVWYYLIPLLALLLLAGFSYRNMRIEQKPDISDILESLRTSKQALSSLESDYLEGRTDPDTYRLKRAQIKARIDELKAALNNIQQAAAK